MAANPGVDAFIARSKEWRDELVALRPILLASGLTEEVKWGKPCYCLDGKNIAVVQPMKAFLGLMFFKGALVPDPHGVLEAQGPNSRSARRVCFRSVDDVARLGDSVAALLEGAIAVEEAGLEVGAAPPNDLCDELQRRLDEDPALAAAFASLTPGRRREYDLYVAGAKRPATRESRVDRCVPRILDLKGLRDR